MLQGSEKQSWSFEGTTPLLQPFNLLERRDMLGACNRLWTSCEGLGAEDSPLLGKTIKE